MLDAPTTMKVGETRAVHANVGINVPIDVLRKYVSENNRKVERSLKISQEMSASLTGENFKITPTTPEKQSVAEGYPTVWSWDIEAEKEGKQKLEATLYALHSVGSNGCTVVAERLKKAIPPNTCHSRRFHRWSAC